MTLYLKFPPPCYWTHVSAPILSHKVKPCATHQPPSYSKPCTSPLVHTHKYRSNQHLTLVMVTTKISALKKITKPTLRARKFAILIWHLFLEVIAFNISHKGTSNTQEKRILKISHYIKALQY